MYPEVAALPGRSSSKGGVASRSASAREACARAAPAKPPPCCSLRRPAARDQRRPVSLRDRNNQAAATPASASPPAAAHGAMVVAAGPPVAGGPLLRLSAASQMSIASSTREACWMSCLPSVRRTCPLESRMMREGRPDTRNKVASRPCCWPVWSRTALRTYPMRRESRNGTEGQGISLM